MFKKYDFIAIDCEKASNEPTSLCSIGIACFKNGKIKDTKEYIIRPYPFEFYQGAIINNCYHEVPIDIYENAPTINKVWPKINKFFKKNLLVGHGINGDLQAIQIALKHYGINYTPPAQDECICTNIASIYTYPEYESHKLKSLCDKLNIGVNPHHALSDAKAAGFLLLDMMNVADCKTASEFIDICAEYNQIITTKYTEKNIEKYRAKIQEIFNYSESDLKLSYLKKENLVNNIVNFYKKETFHELPKIKIINCISPIIEIYSSAEYNKYSDELIKLTPFTKDDFLYLKTNQDEYTLFFGLMTDRCNLILNLFLFLSKITIDEPKKNYLGMAYKRILEYREALRLWYFYLLEEEDIDEIDIYKYIKFSYFTEFEYFKSFEFDNQYNIMLNDPGNAETIFHEMLKPISKTLGIYLALMDCFSSETENLELPNYFNGTFNLFDSLVEIFELDSKNSFADFSYLIDDWFDNNIRNIA